MEIIHGAEVPTGVLLELFLPFLLLAILLHCYGLATAGDALLC